MNILKLKKTNTQKAIDEIEDYLFNTKEKDASVDISDLNLIDASRCAILCSTKLFAQYPNKKIFWSIRDEQTKKMISNLRLQNMELEIKENTLKNRAFISL